MRILVVSNLYPPEWLGGYEISCQQVVDGLTQRGHQVTVLTAASPGAWAQETPQIRRVFHLADLYREAWTGGPPGHLGSIEHEAKISRYFNIAQLLTALHTIRPDIVYLFNPLGLGILGLIDALDTLGMPWLWHLGDRIPIDALEAVSPAVRSLFACGRNRDFSTGACITVSQRLHQAITQAGITLGDRVYPVPYWGQTGLMPPLRPERMVGPTRFVSAGTICRRKGSDLILEAAALLRQRGLETFTIDLYGPGQPGEFIDLAGALGISAHVRFLGPKPQAELYALYADYDAFLFPTWLDEAFGLVPVEAASSGCPAIMTYGCGAAEWFVHEVNCLKIRRDAGDLADAMARLMLDAPLRRTLGRRARDLARSSLDFAHNLTRIEAALTRECRGIAWDNVDWQAAHRLAYIKDRLAMHFFVEGY